MAHLAGASQMSKPFENLSLVGRLRRIVESGRHWDAAGPSMLKAAAEIERLSRESAEKEAAFMSCSNERMRIAMDRQRLRAALEQILRIVTPFDGVLAREIAREALKVEQGPE